MSFKKFQLISPDTIGSPEPGFIYFGRDNGGLWEKYSNGEWVHIITGGTTGAGTSGSSGANGNNGADGSFFGSNGSSGFSGTSGVNGTSGTSGVNGNNGTSGTSGTSGYSGTNGTSGTTGSSGTSGSSGSSGDTGTSGSSGSSGKDGNFYGSSGSSGFSGGYGGSTRKWISTTTESSCTSGRFFGTSGFAGGYDFTLLDKIVINKIDGDNQILSYWLNTWQAGTLKIENRNNNSIFGLYDITSSPVIYGNTYVFTGITCRSGNGSILDDQEHLISFVVAGSLNYYVIQTGITISTGITTTSSNSYIKIISSGMTITLHNATKAYTELIIKNASNGDVNIHCQSSTIDGYIDFPIGPTQCLTIKDDDINNWSIVNLYQGL